MTRNSMRSSRLFRWRYLRWAIAIPTLPVVWWACTSHPLTQPQPSPEQQTDIYITVSTKRLLDLVVMVDNSPSMAPKVSKMNDQFTKLIGALKDPSTQELPDLRVAVIDSDLGTGCRYTSGSCGPKKADGTGCFGDQGLFQVLSKPTDCGVAANAQFLEVKGNTPANFTGFNGDVNKVFACLASNLGTMGCGEEAQLQAFEFALAATGVGTEEQQKAFLRSSAYLGLVFLTDEDDCSVATNYNMMGDITNPAPDFTDLRNESASLRCSTRAHQCGNQNLADRSDQLPGYPTNRAYTHAFNDCHARTDTCPNPTDGTGSTDSSQPTSCAPLKNIEHLANEIKRLKEDPDNQILVAGIFGWPRADESIDKAVYKIDKVPNPNSADTQHPQVWDYWPVCYDPDHPPTKLDPTTNFDPDAAGWGATGGLRNAAFVDQFKDNGLKFSICERDFSKALDGIGKAIAKKLQNLCVDYKLMDTDVSQEGLQPDCRVVWRTPDPNSPDPAHVNYIENPNSLPPCPPNSSQGNVTEDCWTLARDQFDKCPKTGQLIQVFRTAAELNNPATKDLPAGTKVGMQCRTCTDYVPPKCSQDPTLPECRACNY